MKKKSINPLLAAVVIVIFLAAPAIYANDLVTGVPKDEGMSADRLARIDAHLSQTVGKKRVKGIVAMVARNSKVVYHKAFGDMDEEKAMQEDTIFRICSMSKPITAVAVMMLWEQGLFKLNDPIYKFIPEFKDVKVLVRDKAEKKGYKLLPAKRPITIRNLLAHTSGITAGFWAQPFISQYYLDNNVPGPLSVNEGTIADGVKRLAKCPLLFHPGEGWEYGWNFDVLGYLVEVVSGMPFDKFLKKNIFGPLNMRDTFFFVPDEKLSRLASIYEPTGEGGLKKLDRKVVTKGFLSDTKSKIYSPFYSYKGPKTYFSGGGGLHSTAKDYMRFCQMMLNGGEIDSVRILSPTTIDLMISNHMDDNEIWWIPDGSVKYGLGFGILTDRDASANSRPNGTYFWSGFYHTRFYIDPKHDLIAMYYSQIYPNNHVEDVINEYFDLTQQAIVK